jgi:hypothetical protein
MASRPPCFTTYGIRTAAHCIPRHVSCRESSVPSLHAQAQNDQTGCNTPRPAHMALNALSSILGA